MRNNLFILHTTPPVHGASKVGDCIIKHFSGLNKNHNKFIQINFSDSIENLGKFSIRKLFKTIYLFLKIITLLIFHRPRKVYFTPHTSGFALYRDTFIVCLFKLYSLVISTKIFVHYHSRDFNFLNNFLFKKIYKNICFIVLDKKISKDLILHNVSTKTYYLPNGVSSSISNTNLRKSLQKKFNNNLINILFLSNMIREKGFFNVLEIAKDFKHNNNIKFNFAGSWNDISDKTLFFNYIKKYELKNVIFHGFVSGEKKKDLFLNSNLFIFPSSYKNEIFPLVLIEALSYGVPVLANDIGNLKSIINNKTGLISTLKDLKINFKYALKKLNNLNTANNCRNYYDNNFTDQVFLENFEKIINDNKI